MSNNNDDPTPVYDELHEGSDWRDSYLELTDTPVVADHTVDENGQPTLTPQPKVIAGAITGVALTVAVAMLTAITPDLFDWAGRWAGVLFAGVVALGSAIAAYVKRPGNVVS